MKDPVRVTVTGAAGNIGYALNFRIAAGNMLGPDQPVILQLLEITPALNALQGVVMEFNDCAFPLVQGIVATDDLNVAFKDTDYALLVGPGLEAKGWNEKTCWQPMVRYLGRKEKPSMTTRHAMSKYWSLVIQQIRMRSSHRATHRKSIQSNSPL